LSSYYCILNTPGVPVREIAVLKAADDASATVEARCVAGRWPGFETVVVYEGERLVAVVANPSLGFAPQPLDLTDAVDWRDQAA
jgi:hypothetical protein